LNSKGSNVLLHGIPLLVDPQTNKETNLETRVVDYLSNNLGLSITGSDVNAVHRLGRNAATNNPSKPPPIVLQLTSCKTRSQILTRRKLLEGKQIIITEHPTARKTQMLKKVTDMVTLKKLDGAWAHDGRIFAKTLTNGVITVTASNIDNL